MARNILGFATYDEVLGNNMDVIGVLNLSSTSGNNITSSDNGRLSSSLESRCSISCNMGGNDRNVMRDNYAARTKNYVYWFWRGRITATSGSLQAILLAGTCRDAMPGAGKALIGAVGISLVPDGSGGGTFQLAHCISTTTWQVFGSSKTETTTLGPWATDRLWCLGVNLNPADGSKQAILLYFDTASGNWVDYIGSGWQVSSQLKTSSIETIGFIGGGNFDWAASKVTVSLRIHCSWVFEQDESYTSFDDGTYSNPHNRVEDWHAVTRYPTGDVSGSGWGGIDSCSSGERWSCVDDAKDAYSILAPTNPNVSGLPGDYLQELSTGVARLSVRDIDTGGDPVAVYVGMIVRRDPARVGLGHDGPQKITVYANASSLNTTSPGQGPGSSSGYTNIYFGLPLAPGAVAWTETIFNGLEVELENTAAPTYPCAVYRLSVGILGADMTQGDDAVCLPNRQQKRMQSGRTIPAAIQRGW